MILALSLQLLAQGYDSSLAVEVYAGGIVAPAGILGMGGAYTAIAEGSGAQLMNPAAVANRSAHNGNVWFDWDASFDVMSVNPTTDRVDLENSGAPVGTSELAQQGLASLGLIFGRLGVGVAVNARQFGACTDLQAASCPEAEAFVQNGLLAALSTAYVFRAGEVVLGAQLRIPGAAISLGGEQSAAAKWDGAGGAFGVVLRPPEWPIRLGATLEVPIAARRVGAGDGAVFQGRVLPDRVVWPAQLAVGAAFAWAGRPMNLRTSLGDEALAGDELVESMRRYVLVAVDLVLTGPSQRAVSQRVWLAQARTPVGEHTTVGLRAGVESEFWVNRMRARGGSYWEPSRFADAAGRLHLTAGLDVRVLTLVWDWRLTAALDVARDYSNGVLSLGFWH